jgi:hypothetical protein
MATLQLHLPDGLKTAAERRAADAGYGSVDNYIASLIAADQVAPITDDEEAALLKALDSGPAVDLTPEFLSDLKRRARADAANGSR